MYIYIYLSMRMYMIVYLYDYLGLSENKVPQNLTVYHDCPD